MAEMNIASKMDLSGVLQATSIVDSRLDINQQRQIVVEQGTPAYTVFKSPANSADSTSNINWMIQPPRGNVVDSRLLMTFYFKIVFTANATGPGLPPIVDIGNTDALRAFPIHSILETASLEINGTAFNYNPAESISHLQQYINDDDIKRQFSTTACYTDKFQSYRDPAIYGMDKNPLGLYGSNSYYSTRGSLDYKVEYDNKDPALASTATVYVKVTEPLMVSPALFTSQVTQPGFIGINQLRIVLKTGELTRCWSRLDKKFGTRELKSLPVVTFSDAPLLTYTCLTLNPTLAAFNPNAHYYYPFFAITTQIWNGASSIGAGASVTLNGNAITLSFIPARLYLVVCKKSVSRNMYDTDSEFRIDSVSIQIENTVGILSTAFTNDLYQISTQNGLNQDYSGWNQFRGSVFCAQFGKDLSLRENLAVGMQHNFQVSCKVTATNLSKDPLDCDLKYIYVQPGMIDIHSGRCDSTANLVTPENVIMSRSNPYSHSMASYDKTLPFGGAMVMGGGFFGNLWSGIKSGIGKVAEWAPKLAGYAAQAAPVIGTVGNIAGRIGDALGNSAAGSGLVFGGGVTDNDTPATTANSPFAPLNLSGKLKPVEATVEEDLTSDTKNDTVSTLVENDDPDEGPTANLSPVQKMMYTTIFTQILMKQTLIEQLKENFKSVLEDNKAGKLKPTRFLQLEFDFNCEMQTLQDEVDEMQEKLNALLNAPPMTILSVPKKESSRAFTPRSNVHPMDRFPADSLSTHTPSYNVKKRKYENSANIDVDL